MVEIRGNATDDNFAYYRLDYGAGTQPDVWLQIGEQQTAPGRDIVHGDVGHHRAERWRGLHAAPDDGPYRQHAWRPSYVSVTVDNPPPTVTLVDADPGAQYRLGQDVYVPLQAEPDDNVQMAYVEFYQDGELIATSEEWPYTARWDITEAGGLYILGGRL